MSATSAYASYESIRHRLPTTNNHQATKHINTLLDIAEQFDTYFFDAFGVLNVGNTAIPNAVSVVNELQKIGKQCFVVSNAAGFAKPFYLSKYQKLGFNFPDEHIIISRDAVLKALQSYPKDMRWGRIGPNIHQEDLDGLGINIIDQEDTAFSTADGFLFFSPARWDKERQKQFTQMLTDMPRPVLLGNPDLIAPLGNSVSIEAGSYVLTMDDEHFLNVEVFGKPFSAIYKFAVSQLTKVGHLFNPERAIMLGDTLHTDIIGAHHFGIKAALVYGHGFFKDIDYQAHIEDSGIIPDFVLPQI